MPLHCLDPESKTEGTQYRSVLCDPRVVYLCWETQRRETQKQRQNAIDDTIRLRTAFKAHDQPYYTKDKKKVSCKKCKHIMCEGKKRRNFKSALWVAKFVMNGKRKNGCWIVVADDVLKHVFAGANRKNQEAALAMVRENNNRIRAQARLNRNGNG